jgi:hypothetical protein
MYFCLAALLYICKSGRAPKRVRGVQSGRGPDLDHSEHLPLYRCRVECSSSTVFGVRGATHVLIGTIRERLSIRSQVVLSDFGIACQFSSDAFPYAYFTRGLVAVASLLFTRVQYCSGR